MSERLLKLISNHVTLLLKSQCGSLLDKVQNFHLEIKILPHWLPSYLFSLSRACVSVKPFLHLVDPVLQSKSKALLIVSQLPASSLTLFNPGPAFNAGLGLLEDPQRSPSFFFQSANLYCSTYVTIQRGKEWQLTMIPFYKQKHKRSDTLANGFGF